MDDPVINVRQPFEQIFFRLAKTLAEEAKQKQMEWEETGSVGAYVSMRDKALLSTLMSLTSLEAFINVRAKEWLPKAIWEKTFEGLQIKQKWQLLPYILAQKEWNEGCQPFQDFAELVKLRNGLVHYKATYTPYRPDEPVEPINLPLARDLTGENALRWCHCATEMAQELKRMVGAPT